MSNLTPEQVATMRAWHGFQPGLLDGVGRRIPCGCVICGRDIEPKPLYFTSEGEPRHMLCDANQESKP